MYNLRLAWALKVLWFGLWWFVLVCGVLWCGLWCFVVVCGVLWCLVPPGIAYPLNMTVTGSDICIAKYTIKEDVHILYY